MILAGEGKIAPKRGKHAIEFRLVLFVNALVVKQNVDQTLQKDLNVERKQFPFDTYVEEASCIFIHFDRLRYRLCDELISLWFWQKLNYCEIGPISN